MTSLATSRAPSLIDRWIEALLDPQRQERSVALSLAVYTAIWTAYRMIATWPRDVHADVSELYGWSRHLAFGYDKHPPFSALVTRAWFSVVPVSDVTFHLLATVNIALTLYIAWRTMRRYLAPEKALFGLALLTFVPFFNFIALKYNANAVLLPLWALTIYGFLRAFEARGWLWPALAGLFAGASMLGKYWSIVLVGALGLGALLDPRRGRFFASPAPWLMILVGGLVLAPHLAWLVAHRFPSFAYAAAHESDGFVHNLRDTLGYLAGCVGYAGLALIVWAALLRPSRAALADSAWPADPQRRLIVTIQLLMLAAPAPVALATGVRIVPLWTMPAFTLLPIVLLSSPLIAVGRDALRSVLIGAAALALAILAAAPGVAVVIHTTSPPEPFEYASLLADDIAKQWGRHSSQPIGLAAGETVLAANTAYYLRTDTRAFETSDIAALKAEITTRGGALVCSAADQPCLAIAEQIVAGQNQILRSKVWLSRPLFGIAGGTVQDVFFLVLPEAGAGK
ncbi:glycosyltransferase family 39 protein [Rhodopseudomonas sp. HC1]|uniref:glycosyltransferase family 39 protein n=1 Tax=Rhodopseudomonas infernalis TaxID=2897386 RepID=UPI001EE7F183|nr:glycosyltransferase family 39 protein [Rhodopseudomonas infernalis]MCG6206457.1 glycosyltransferase family 39 protein [Rhodopseudomonas infernalis]